MSKYDEWLAAKGIVRGHETAMDEILWLREERNRLRLTDAEREAVEFVVGHRRDQESWVHAALRGLLERSVGSTGSVDVETGGTMTDRFHSLVVFLESDTREDDAQTIINAIRAVRGVADVSGEVADIDSHMAEIRARADLGKKIIEVIYQQAGK